MFIIVTFPWPVASADVELTRYEPAIDRHAPHYRRRDEQAQPELAGAGRSR